jgi:Zn-finger protein
MSSNTKTVHLFGYGVYEGNFEREIYPGLKMNNPRIKLDSGKTVWGCECWWADEAEVKDMVTGKNVVEVDIDEERRRA